MTPDLTDPAAFRQAVARLLKAQPSRSEFWTCLLEAADANKVTETDREMVAAGMRRILNFDAPPALHFVNGADGEEVQMAFGYFRGEPTAAVFRGSDEAPIMIPREVLQIALEQGWEER